MEPQDKTSRPLFTDSVGAGFLASLLAHFAIGSILGLAHGETTVTWLVCIGVAQLPYLIPLALYFRSRGMTMTTKGIWVAMAITFLVNAACWGSVMISLG